MPEPIAPTSKASGQKSRRGTENRQKEKPVSVRMSLAELATVDAEATRTNLSRGSYIRTMVFGGVPLRAARSPSIVLQDLARLRGQIGKLGNNVNQLAKLANEGRGPFTKAEAVQMVADIAAMRAACLSALGAKAAAE